MEEGTVANIKFCDGPGKTRKFVRDKDAQRLRWLDKVVEDIGEWSKSDIELVTNGRN